MTTPAGPRYDLTAFERWESVALHGRPAGFLHRVLEGRVLTTRMAFEPPADLRAQAPEVPARFLAQCVVEFTADGSTWEAAVYEDSATEQRVRIERERAGIAADVVPSYAEFLLLTAAAADAVAYRRLEEASPLQGGLRVLEAVLRPVAGETAGEGTVRVDLLSEGHVLGVHRVRPGLTAAEALAGPHAGVLASDWGGGTTSTPVASADAALAGLSADVVAFARLPRG